MCEVYIYDWKFTDSYIGENGEKELVVYAYGMDENRNTVKVSIRHFKPYFYIELPPELKKDGKVLRGDLNKFKNIVSAAITSRKGNSSNSSVIITEVKRKKLYYCSKKVDKKTGEYVDKNHLFLLCQFKNVQSLKRASYILKRKIPTAVIHEDNWDTGEREEYIIMGPKEGRKKDEQSGEKVFRGGGISPILYYCSTYSIDLTGWVSVDGERIQRLNPTITSGAPAPSYVEYICSYRGVTPLKKSAVIEPRVLSFDIEAYSSDKYTFCDYQRPEDVVFCIGVVVEEAGNIDKYILSLGDPEMELLREENITVVLYERESDLLCGFRDMVCKINPHVVIGYNIFGFDYKYMMGRAAHLKCDARLSRIGIDNTIQCRKLSEMFESTAHGYSGFFYYDIEGRLQLDIMFVIKRDYKLVEYSLKSVTKHFGVQTKDPLTHKDLFHAWKCHLIGDPSAGKKLALVLKYCTNDALVTLYLYKKLQMWYGMGEMSKITQVPMFYLFTEGTQIQLYSQLLSRCIKGGYVIDKKSYAYEKVRYEGAIVLEPVPGMYDDVLSFDFASLYPSIMMAYNIDYSTLVKEPESFLIGKYDSEGYKVWDKFPVYIKLDDRGPEVKDITKEYEDRYSYLKQVHSAEELEKEVLALRQRYPNKLIVLQQELSEIDDEHCNVFEFEQHIQCVHDINRKRKKNGEYSKAKTVSYCSQHRCRFIKAEYGGKGIVPTLLEEKIAQRKQTRKQIKENVLKLVREIITYLAETKTWVDKILNNEEEKELGFNDRFTYWNENGEIDISKVNEYMEKQDKLEAWIEKCKTEYEEDVLALMEEIGNPIKESNIVERKLKKTPRLIDSLIDEMGVVELQNTILEKRQLALKVCANSMYGALASCKLPLVEGAISITYKGRCSIEFISKYIPNKYDGKTVYGDSVTGDTPIIIKRRVQNTERREIITIEELAEYLERAEQEESKEEKSEVFNDLSVGLSQYINPYIDHGRWVEYNEFKSQDDERFGKQQYIPTHTVYVWGNDNWTPIKRIIRHRVGKKIMRVSTNTGIVDVTEDHSLLLDDKTPIKPEDVKIGNILLSSFPIMDGPDTEPLHKYLNYYVSSTGIDAVRIYLYGAFMARGMFTDSKNIRFTLNNSYCVDKCIECLKYLVQYPDEASKDELGEITTITIKSKKIFMEYKERFSTSNPFFKKVPAEVINGGFPYACYFLNGMADTTDIPPQAFKNIKIPNVQIIEDGFRIHPDIPKLTNYHYFTHFNILGKIGAQGVYYLLKYFDYRVTVSCISTDYYHIETGEKEHYRLSCTKRIYGKTGNVESLLQLPISSSEPILGSHGKSRSDFTNGKWRNIDKECKSVRVINDGDIGQFVYDLETEEGLFHAGIGEIVVKNTDSTHIYFPGVTDGSELTKRAKNIIWDMETFFHKPMRLEFEKIYKRYLILTKKRYICQVANSNGVITGVNRRGVVLCRRDSSVILRDIYQDLSDKILYRVSKDEIIYATVKWVNCLFNYHYSYKDFAITKSLNRDVYIGKTKPVHYEIALRMRRRNVDIPIGAKITYILTELGREKGAHVKQHEKAVDIEVYQSNKDVLKIDYLYTLHQYINQLDDLLGIGAGIFGLVEEQYHLREIYNNILLEYKEKLEKGTTIVIGEPDNTETKYIYNSYSKKKVKSTLNVPIGKGGISIYYCRGM